MKRTEQISAHNLKEKVRVLRGDFTFRCLSLIKSIPRGKVTTYKLLASALGTKAYRAVGRAVASNKDFKGIPCHRVIKTSGEIGGYSGPGGILRKKELLKKEGIEITGNRVLNPEKRLYQYD